MSYYCVKCGKEIKETTPDNGLYCRDCQAAGKQELILLTNDPRTVSAYRDAAGESVSENGKSIFTPPPEQAADKPVSENGKHVFTPPPEQAADRSVSGNENFVFIPYPEQAAGKSGSENEKYFYIVPLERQNSPADRDNTRSGGYDQPVGYRPGDQAHYSHTAPLPKNNSGRVVLIVICALVAVAAVVAAVICIPPILRDRTDNTPAAEQTADIEVKEINLRDKLTSLIATDAALGLRDRYASFDDISDGFVDTDLVGTWVSADGEKTWTYNKDGTITADEESDFFLDTERKITYAYNHQRFTCKKVGGYKVICTEAKSINRDTKGNETESTVLFYFTYDVYNDVLYMTAVVQEIITGEEYGITVMYRTDADGSAETSMANNKIAIDAFTGTWASEKGRFTIEDGKLILGEDVYDISVNENGLLVVASGDSSTGYWADFYVSVRYDDENGTDVITNTSMYIHYTGEGANDKPNLLSVLDDLKAKYQWDEWYYSGSFYLQ